MGIGVGVYLIQQQTHFLPQAFSGKEILDLFSDQQTPISSPQTFAYRMTTPRPAAKGSVFSVFQLLMQRRANQSPTPAPITPTRPSPTPIVNNLTSSSTLQTATLPPSNTSTQNTQNNSTQTSTSTTQSKPICSVTVIPASTGQAPYAASVCVGNNSNPYQAVQQEWVDYEGNGSWDYQGSSWGCHSFTFQNPGTYYPKAKIIATSGAESDICQTTVTISGTASTPAPTSAPAPTPTPTSNPTAPTVSSVSTMTATAGNRITIYGNNFLSSTTTDVTTLQVWLVHSDGGVNILASVSPNTGSTSWEQNAISFTIGQVAPQSGQLKVLAGNSYANVSGVFTITSP